MNPADYYRSVTLELDALKSRVRNLIADGHWPTDGEWKESVLRTVLRRHMPSTTGVGRGFIISQAGASTQIDVLLYDTGRPVLRAAERSGKQRARQLAFIADGINQKGV